MRWSALGSLNHCTLTDRRQIIAWRLHDVSWRTLASILSAPAPMLCNDLPIDINDPHRWTITSLLLRRICSQFLISCKRLVHVLTCMNVVCYYFTLYNVQWLKLLCVTSTYEYLFSFMRRGQIGRNSILAWIRKMHCMTKTLLSLRRELKYKT